MRAVGNNGQSLTTVAEDDEPLEEGAMKSRRHGINVEKDEQSTASDDDGSQMNEVGDEDERINVHVKHQIQPEDEELMRDFNRIIVESMQVIVTLFVHFEHSFMTFL